MRRYSEAAWERAMAKRITWWQAAEIVGISDRSLRRRYEQYGYDGLFDRRRGQPSPKRVPMEVAEEVLRLYQAKYADLNMRHFHQQRVAHSCFSTVRLWGFWKSRIRLWKTVVRYVLIDR